MPIHHASFVISSPDVTMCPSSPLPEYAFIGRSNVGKSSLINMLCRDPHLAKTSQKPGKTLLINHFLVDGKWHLVDLPGYGFAQTGQKQREKLRWMIERYCLARQELVSLFVLIDCRLEPQSLYQDRQTRAHTVAGKYRALQRKTLRDLGRTASYLPYLGRERRRSRRSHQLYRTNQQFN